VAHHPKRPAITGCAVAALLAAILGLVASPDAQAAPQVVGDDACPIYAEDIAAFATCEGDRVVRPEASTPPSEVREVTAREAHALITQARGRALFVDVRTWHEVALVGRPLGLDAVLPFEEIDSVGGPVDNPSVRMRARVDFVPRIGALVDERVLSKDAPIVLICRSGERSRKAAQMLTAAGFTQVMSVRDGFEGPAAKFGHDRGKRNVAGWRHDGLPWKQAGG
jgi:rhodanese-related sulfurtransferase